MNKKLKSISCVLAATCTFLVVQNTMKVGPLAVDVVSAATGEAPATPAPASAPAPSKPAATKPTTTSSSYTFSSVSRLLALGAAGNDVKLVQTNLNDKGYKLTVDGFFGNLTLNAVKGFQSSNGLAADGIVGPKTLAVLIPSSAVPTSIVKVGSVNDDVKYLQTNLNKLGYKLSVDGIFGNLTSAAVKAFQKDNGLVVDGIAGPNTFGKLFEKVSAPAASTTPTTPTSQQTSIKIGRAEYAAHGTKCFTVAVVAMAGDKIVGASVDDYQYTAPTGFVGVPNSDKDFGKNYPAGQVLISKRTNSDAYSANMAKSAGATQTWVANMTGVEKFANGKTIAELDAAINGNKNADGTNKDAKVDAVTSATFADTNGYLSAILAAAKDAKENTTVQVDASQLSNIKIGRAEYAAHGTKCFTVAVTVMAGDKIVAASVDDYQFTAPTGFVGVPNSDKDFGKNYPAGQILISKRTNTAAYSANMAKSAGATQAWDVNMAGVEKFATGKTIVDLDAAIKGNKNADGTNKDAKVDAVTSATFADTNGYLSSILEAAKSAK